MIAVRPTPSAVIYARTLYSPALRRAIYSMMTVLLLGSLTASLLWVQSVAAERNKLAQAALATRAWALTLTAAPTGTPTLTLVPSPTLSPTLTATITITPSPTLTLVPSPTITATIGLMNCSYSHKVTGSTKNFGNSFNAIETAGCTCGELVCGCYITTEYPNNPAKNSYNIWRPNVGLATLKGLVALYGGTCK
jgi:hypothetical protein